LRINLLFLLALCFSMSRELEAASWTPLDGGAPAPSPRMAHQAVFDAQRGRMILLGGNSMSGLLMDVWVLSFEPSPEWTMISAAGTPPSPRWDHAAAYDPKGDRVLLFGGDDASGFFPRNDVWALTLSDPITWIELHPEGAAPPGRSSHVVVFDPLESRLLVHGGFDGIGLLSDLWELSLSGTPTWQPLSPSGPAPIARRDAVGTYDAGRSRMLLHGGNANVAPFLSDTWALDLNGTPSWTPIEPNGAVPEGAITHAGVYDATRERLLIFGGNYHNETWALPFIGPPEWTRILPSAPLPPGRIDHTIVFDPVRDRFLAFGGHTGLSMLNDAWELSLDEATEVGRSEPTLGLTISPNPARREATFWLDSPAPGGSFTIFDVTGRVVESLNAAHARLSWDLRTADGTRVPAGVYFCAWRSREANAVGRLVVQPEE
jgi:hypothetical protein